MDIVEITPSRDINDITSLAAGYFVLNAIGALARSGLRAPTACPPHFKLPDTRSRARLDSRRSAEGQSFATRVGINCLQSPEFGTAASRDRMTR